MTITLGPADPAPVSISRKSPQNPLVKLQREPEFYQHAWDEVRPFLMGMVGELVRDWGFHKEEPEMNETPLFVRLHKTAPDGSIILLELPQSISALTSTTNVSTASSSTSGLSTSVLPPQTFISANHPIQIATVHLDVPLLAEIVYMLRCFLVGLAPTRKPDTHEVICLPDVAWLLKRELVLREAFGCTYFRYLVDAARQAVSV